MKNRGRGRETNDLHKMQRETHLDIFSQQH